MKSTQIEFTNSNGEILSAKLEMPILGEPKAFAIFAHCFTCTKNFSAVKNISRGLTQQDIGVLRFDFTGLGESEGDFADTNFSTNIDDLIAASEFLTEHYEAPKILVGHSLGGAAIIHAAARIPSVEALATIGAPADPPHVLKLLSENIDEINSSGKATVKIGGRPFTIKKQFVEDIQEKSTCEVLRDLRIPIIIFHSPQDMIVDITNASKLYDYAFHPKSYISLNKSDHLLSNEADSVYVGNVISGWSARYVSFNQEKELLTDKQVVVRTSDSYTTEGKARTHSMILDEPLNLKGDDHGPTPYEYLLASLGSCTSITLRMYANRKGWDLKEVKVHLEREQVHLKDSEDCPHNDCRIDKIDRHLEFTGDLTQDQIERLLQIADKCPVHRTLTGEIKITTKLLETIDQL